MNAWAGRHRRGRVACALALALAATSAARGREYVVDGAHASADDRGDGTAGRPLKTIARAAALARAGDRVVVKAGVYRESVRLRHSGRAGAPIVFSAEPPGGVVVTGADVVSDFRPVDANGPIYRTPWDRVFAINHVNGRPVEHYPAESPVFGRAEQVVVDGHHLVATAGLAGLRRALAQHGEAFSARRKGEPFPAVPAIDRPATWTGLFAADTAGKALYVCLADGSDPRSRRVEVSSRGQVFGVNPWQQAEGVRHVHVRGFVFRYGATFPQRAGVWLHGGLNELTDCVIDGFAGSGVSVHGRMARCVVRHCGHTGGGAQGAGFANEDCLWVGNCWKPISRGWDAGGFKICRASGGVFRRCAFVRNGGPGLWLDIDDTDVLIAESAFVDNELSGVFVEISRNITVTRNLFLRNGVGSAGGAPSHDWSVAGIQIAESRDCTVTFNTCVGNKDGIALREQGPRPLDTADAGRIAYRNVGHVIASNVCAGNLGWQLALWYDNGFFGWHPAEKARYKTPAAYEAFLRTRRRPVYDPADQRMLIDRNVYFPAAGQGLVLYGTPWRPKHRTFADVRSFAAATGFARAGQVADPGFVDAGAGNYRFAAGGAARRLRAGWSTAPASVSAWLKARAGAKR